MKKRVFISGLIIITLLSSVLFIKPKEKEKIIYEATNNMLSYTIDGEPTKEKPSKGGVYIANKIECEKGTNIVWDNTNWTAEIKNVVSEDVCNIDFTSNINTEGYRVTINSNNNSSMDSLSKATIKGGTIEFESPSEIKSVSGCTGVIKDGKIVIENVISSQTCNVITELPKFYDKLLTDNSTHTGSRPNAFSGVYTDDNTGVMYVASGNATEDGSNVYYFAGNAKNNWVKFGKDKDDNDLYWRIIRTNEDGSVRMLYAGTSPSTTEGYITETRNDGTIENKTWYGPNSSTYNHPKYVGYMYGNSGNTLANARTNGTNSGIKTMIDNWYRDGLNTKTDGSGNTYDKYISQTAIYCNDRAHEGTYSTSANFYYAAFYRLFENKTPSYKCGNDASGSLYSTSNSADKFSKSTSKGGNGKLTYPVALITADEISFAGGKYNTNAPAWHYYNSGTDSITGSAYWWTMSPYYFASSYTSTLFAVVFVVLGSDFPGHLSSYNVHGTNAVRPVLSLKSCITWKSGNGAWNTPYEVEVSSSCALAEN